ERFQAAQFSPVIGEGAKRKEYKDAKPILKAPRSKGAKTLRDLCNDPNSRVQKGGTGYLRKPLDEPRSTRADAPEWFHRREGFFKTLSAKRAVRAEQIFSGFYIDKRTDRQIAEAVRWSKDSVKNERADLIRMGNRFFCEGPQG